MIWRFVSKYPFTFEGYLQRARDRGFFPPFFWDGMGNGMGKVESQGQKGNGEKGVCWGIYISIDCRIFQLEPGNQHYHTYTGKGKRGGKGKTEKRGARYH